MHKSTYYTKNSRSNIKFQEFSRFTIFQEFSRWVGTLYIFRRCLPAIVAHLSAGERPISTIPQGTAVCRQTEQKKPETNDI